MNVLNGLLSVTDQSKAISFLGDIFPVSLNWLGKLIRGLIEGVGIVGVGIILFSVILKLIVLPFDIYQRVSMSKQNIKMKEMQGKLEKMQKQYANDKAMYNQKMMELYKENGISVFSSCLPAILSIVIFIVAINAFNSFSQYANLQNYNQMVTAYNASIASHCATLEDEISFEDKYIVVKSSNPSLNEKYIYFVVENTQNLTLESSLDEKKAFLESAEKRYYVNSDALYADKADEVDALKGEGENALSTEQASVAYMEKLAQENVKKVYDEKVKEDMGFLWIKNIWETDASYKHPVLKYSDFKSSVQKEKLVTDDGKVSFGKIDNVTTAYTEASYTKVTGLLSAEKKQANGYYVLIVLSIGTILLQQFVSMRMQKEQQKYSSVDGQGAMNQKTMIVVMTVMFAIFSFMYSSAFSIYMITSNLFSLLTSVIINKLVSVSVQKKEAKALQEKYDRRFPNRTSNRKK